MILFGILKGLWLFDVNIKLKNGLFLLWSFVNLMLVWLNKFLLFMFYEVINCGFLILLKLIMLLKLFFRKKFFILLKWFFLL